MSVGVHTSSSVPKVGRKNRIETFSNLESVSSEHDVVGKAGVDVMITIFCDCWPISAKNWRFSQNTYYDPFFSKKLAVVLEKTSFFPPNFFCETIFEIITSVPGVELVLHKSMIF
jgi:hypothetical protein